MTKWSKMNECWPKLWTAWPVENRLLANERGYVVNFSWVLVVQENLLSRGRTLDCLPEDCRCNFWRLGVGFCLQLQMFLRRLYSRSQQIDRTPFGYDSFDTLCSWWFWLSFSAATYWNWSNWAA
jgi:hypothetical protein